jgi:hypothetical protein
MTIRVVTDLRSRAKYQPDCVALARNRIAAARASANLSAAEFAAMLTQLLGRTIAASNVIAWETKATPPGDVLIAADTVSPSSPSRLGVRSHKFVCGHIGWRAARTVGERGNVSDDGTYRTLPAEHPSGQCDLHIWPYGGVIFHLTEDLEVSGIATLALWRLRTYEENLAWATETLRAMVDGDQATATYVLSLYWVHSPIWADRRLDTAMRLVCCPRVLVEREIRDTETCRAGAEQAERMLLAEGYQHPGMRAFGQHGVSAGFASWSGVSYHAFDADRALIEDELIAAEMAVQPVWAYSDWITRGITDGREPDIAKGYGWRFLRAAKLRLTNPGPQETGQHEAMRAAIVETSKLPGMLSQAIEALREDGKP